ncbi:hypothetical protein JY460_01180 [Stenotrophomonas maltophilia]|nr:hypothetical protein [Stenotrophomonas maltophilia]
MLDGSQGAPVGFGFYVGKTRTTYEVVRRGSQGVRRFALGNVTDMGLEEAYQVARELIQELKVSGENPKLKAVRASQQEEDRRLEQLTVADRSAVYIADMTDRVPATVSLKGKELPVGVEIGETEKQAVAPHQGGTRVTFPVLTRNAWASTLTGATIEQGSMASTPKESAIVGYDGALYLEHPEPGMVVEVSDVCKAVLPSPLPA